MRHDTAVLIGSGGMGDVYRAWDPDLERHVALKYLRHSDPELAQRLLREARAQARLDHPNICRIFQAGTDEEGRPFLAMEYVDGRPLDAAARDMCLEEKVEVLRAVAQAVHHAHTHGVIHRDLKPGNVLVETCPDGSFKPYLLDFGLARAEDGTALTRTGEVMGTPAFMAPEQVRGETRRIDRRTDVYALGAVLYALLAGGPPFEGDSTAAVFMQILEAEPPRLSSLDAAIPKDLEVVASTCLEKEPQHRYQTALELAEDLGRWLQGESIAARPVAWPTRVWRRARRHPVVATAALAATVAVLAALTVAVYTRLTAAEQTRLARDFAAGQERLAATLRHIHMLPLHDASGEVAVLRARVAAIAAEVDRLGAVAEGPGHATIGRLQLAFGDLPRARKHLERAMTAGWDRPEVRVALGTTLARLYQQRLAAARGVREPEVRAAVEEAARAELREPALELLRDQPAETGVGGALVRSLVARLEERWDDAVTLAAEAKAEAPWLYEADLRRGEALLWRAEDRLDRGDTEAALADVDAAGEAFAAAAAVGRSDTGVYEIECERLSRLLDREAARSDALAGGAYERAVAACGSALEADPGNGRAHRLLTLLAVRRAAEAWWNRGEDPTADLGVALEHAARAVELAPGDAESHNAAGVAWLLQGRYQSAEGHDPAEALDRAMAAFARASALDEALPTAGVNATICCIELGLWAADHGGDAESRYRQALSYVDDVVELYPDLVPALTTKAAAHFRIAEARFESGRDPRAELQDAIATSQRAAAAAPDLASIQVNMGLALWLLADWEQRTGGAPADALGRSRTAFERALELRPDSVSAWIDLSGTWVTEARYSLALDRDPGEALDRAADALAEAVARYPDDFYVDRGEIQVLRAKWEVRHGRSPEHLLAAGRQALEDGIARYPDRPEQLRMLAELELVRSTWLALEGRSVAPAAEPGIAAATRALELDPDLAEALAVRGALRLALASSDVITGGRRAALVRDAAADLDCALGLNPTLEREHGDRARRARSLHRELSAS